MTFCRLRMDPDIVVSLDRTKLEGSYSPLRIPMVFYAGSLPGRCRIADRTYRQAGNRHLESGCHQCWCYFALKSRHCRMFSRLVIQFPRFILRMLKAQDDPAKHSNGYIPRRDLGCIKTTVITHFFHFLCYMQPCALLAPELNRPASHASSPCVHCVVSRHRPGWYLYKEPIFRLCRVRGPRSGSPAFLKESKPTMRLRLPIPGASSLPAGA